MYIICCSNKYLYTCNIICIVVRNKPINQSMVMQCYVEGSNISFKSCGWIFLFVLYTLKTPLVSIVYACDSNLWSDQESPQLIITDLMVKKLNSTPLIYVYLFLQLRNGGTLYQISCVYILFGGHDAELPEWFNKHHKLHIWIMWRLLWI